MAQALWEGTAEEVLHMVSVGAGAAAPGMMHMHGARVLLLREVAEARGGSAEPR